MIGMIWHSSSSSVPWVTRSCGATRSEREVCAIHPGWPRAQVSKLVLWLHHLHFLALTRTFVCTVESTQSSSRLEKAGASQGCRQCARLALRALRSTWALLRCLSLGCRWTRTSLLHALHNGTIVFGQRGGWLQRVGRWQGWHLGVLGAAPWCHSASPIRVPPPPLCPSHPLAPLRPDGLPLNEPQEGLYTKSATFTTGQLCYTNG
mmetsp:Transcript_84130/g.167907  ORF Transcript_84130/g.167907 Transcript_84130/m.167907 type:complete len:206 (+) Transcript_84130:230-847(+)